MQDCIDCVYIKILKQMNTKSKEFYRLRVCMLNAKNTKWFRNIYNTYQANHANA